MSWAWPCAHHTTPPWSGIHNMWQQLVVVTNMEKKTARQRFLRRTRALTLTISIPSMAVTTNLATDKASKRSESVSNLKRSQSSRDVWSSKRSASENCLDREEEVMSDAGCVSTINVTDIQNNNSEGFGYRLKRSLTVSHILDNLNKSFRVRRSHSQREVSNKKNKTRYWNLEYEIQHLKALFHLVWNFLVCVRQSCPRYSYCETQRLIKWFGLSLPSPTCSVVYCMWDK